MNDNPKVRVVFRTGSKRLVANLLYPAFLGTFFVLYVNNFDQLIESLGLFVSATLSLLLFCVLYLETEFHPENKYFIRFFIGDMCEIASMLVAMLILLDSAFVGGVSEYVPCVGPEALRMPAFFLSLAIATLVSYAWAWALAISEEDTLQKHGQGFLKPKHIPKGGKFFLVWVPLFFIATFVMSSLPFLRCLWGNPGSPENSPLLHFVAMATFLLLILLRTYNLIPVIRRGDGNS